MSMKNSKGVCCAVCGERDDLSYIKWEDQVLCAPHFAEAVSEYAGKYPFLLANELALDIIQVPEREEV